MGRRFLEGWARIEREPAMDILGGVWLVILLMGLLHLPNLLA